MRVSRKRGHHEVQRKNSYAYPSAKYRNFHYYLSPIENVSLQLIEMITLISTAAMGYFTK
jgi:hypothetical protein